VNAVSNNRPSSDFWFILSASCAFVKLWQRKIDAKNLQQRIHLHITRSSLKPKCTAKKNAISLLAFIYAVNKQIFKK
jgi:hypothetical protein